MNKLVKYIIESRFNFNIDLLEDIDNEEEFSLSKQLYKSKSMKDEYIENNLFVDLGLPSGTKWCKYNLGCDFELLSSKPKSTSPKDWYGNYYAWGEIEDKNEYTWETYEFGEDSPFSKYDDDGRTILKPEDDAAYQYNSSWRIPTRELCQELISYTNSKWISGKGKNLYMNVKGLRGRLFTSKINGNQIFIPAAGHMSSSSLRVDSSYCCVWSSSLNIDNPCYAWYLDFDSNDICMSCFVRYLGRSIRSVL